MDDSDDSAYSRPPTLEDVARIGRALNEAQARYVLIGGFAVIVPVASMKTLIRTKQTIRPADHMDCEYLELRIAAEDQTRS